MLRRWLQDDQGATAIEYALIAAFLGMATFTGATLLGAATKAHWESVTDAFTQAMGL